MPSFFFLSLTLCPSNSVSPSEPRTFSSRPCAARSSFSTWCPQPWRGSMSCFQAIVSSAHPSPPESALAKTLSHQWTGPAWLGDWCPDLDPNQASTTRRFCFLLMWGSYLVLIWKTDESGIQCNWMNVLPNHLIGKKNNKNSCLYFICQSRLFLFLNYTSQQCFLNTFTVKCKNSAAQANVREQSASLIIL